MNMDAIAEFTETADSTRLFEFEAQKAQILQTGFIAQEVEAAAQEIGFEFSGVDAPKNAKDHYGLRYAEFVPPLVKALQEQQKVIEAQQAEINTLKEQINGMKYLEREVASIKKQLNMNETAKK